MLALHARGQLSQQGDVAGSFERLPGRRSHQSGAHMRRPRARIGGFVQLIGSAFDALVLDRANYPYVRDVFGIELVGPDHHQIEMPRERLNRRRSHSAQPQLDGIVSVTLVYLRPLMRLGRCAAKPSLF